MPVVSFNVGCYDLQLIKPYLAAVYGTYGPPWLRHFWAYEGPELSAAADGMSPGDRGGDEITSILKKGSPFTAIYTHKLAFLDVCNYLLAAASAMPSILGSMEGLPARGKSFFPMNMWTTWPACETPCPAMPPSTHHCAARTPWKRAWDDLMANGAMLSCVGYGSARAWLLLGICKYITTIVTWYPSWQPYRSSVTSTSKPSWTCSRTGHLCLA